jgi:hypothetical protein
MLNFKEKQKKLNELYLELKLNKTKQKWFNL